ncbi:queuosine precursor transporter [Saxibacter everestensis]|uniref:Probable queuosine precursor transporter n=1 Tax=Saxibacter everestensis TaxID=2909229 RepID=A0ABY8QQB0_9MICO|nr:queuosine precursor transporter [Brevibacteriaceae bacterium ZFBP1038]
MKPASGSPRAQFAKAREGYFAIIVAVFVAVLLISNIAATKLIAFGPIITDGGAFLFPLAYVLGDVLSEVYGFKTARKVILIGFSLLVVACLVFWLVQISPPAPDYQNQAAFEAVLGFVPRLALAGICGYVVGQLLNSWVLVRIKERTLEKKLWLRLLGSTGVGELADTIVFCTIAFYGVITGWTFVNYVVVGYVYKCLVEVAVLPITFWFIRVVKRREPSYGEVREPDGLRTGS